MASTTNATAAGRRRTIFKFCILILLSFISIAIVRRQLTILNIQLANEKSYNDNNDNDYNDNAPLENRNNFKSKRLIERKRASSSSTTASTRQYGSNSNRHTSKKTKTKRTSTTSSSSSRTRLPTCNPHWKDRTTITTTANTTTSTTSQPHPSIKRIYFYHVRKAGGTMIRNYLAAVSARHELHLQMKEYDHASHEEEVGSRRDTLYVTNIRDPVERSISHFKYFGRWDCHRLVKNESYAASEENARRFETWRETGGFEASPCDVPFSMVNCAVNCYVQTFSGRGCPADADGVGTVDNDNNNNNNNNWYSEYNEALDRLLRYDMILVYDKFNDPNYIRAVERFFGVEGFNSEKSDMYCGWESRMANERVPLKVKFRHVLELTKLNEIDNRLYRDLTSCWSTKDDGGGVEEEEEVEYFFPKVDVSIFVAQRNRTVIG